MMSKRTLHVLLVEDNPDHAALAKNAIAKARSCDYQVEVAQSAEEAIDKIGGNPYNMIISDYNLGGKNGLDLLTWLNENNVDIPFLMMTGMGDEKTAVKAIQDGAYNYIVKDDLYLNTLPHVVDETFIKFLADKERDRYEREIREKNVALEKANRELKKVDQLKSDFVSSVSHDIRSPLNSIRESIALILDGVVDVREEKGKHVLQISKRSSERLNKMIDDLLDFSKLEGGKLRVYISPTDIQVLIDESLGSLKSLADRREITYQFEPVKDFPLVPCDGERVVQVLVNLIGNAIKFTPKGGTVSVDVKVENGRALVAVSDTGIGIKKEHLTTIFERFEQVKGADSGGIKGTGLGLAICRELMQLHQGDVWAESEPKKGSRFVIALPLEQEARRMSSGTTGDGTKQSSDNRKDGV